MPNFFLVYNTDEYNFFNNTNNRFLDLYLNCKYISIYAKK